MKLQIGCEMSNGRWHEKELSLPLSTTLTPRLAKDALASAFDAAACGIVWHGLKGYRLYANTWKAVRRLHVKGPVNEFFPYVARRADKTRYGSKTVKKGSK